jgi:hypothetical protein
LLNRLHLGNVNETERLKLDSNCFQVMWDNRKTGLIFAKQGNCKISADGQLVCPFDKGRTDKSEESFPCLHRGVEVGFPFDFVPEGYLELLVEAAR